MSDTDVAEISGAGNDAIFTDEELWGFIFDGKFLLDDGLACGGDGVGALEINSEVFWTTRGCGLGEDGGDGYEDVAE